jgi:HNH endonuclease
MYSIGCTPILDLRRLVTAFSANSPRLTDMQHSLDPQIARSVWARDGYRCQECGIAVAQGRGCKPQTHHIRPRGQGGSDDPSNLVTLCYPCHATKASIGHRALLASTPPELLTDFAKWMLWDLATNLLAYAEWMSPRSFPAERIIEDLEGWKRSLDVVIEQTRDAAQAQSRHIVAGGCFAVDDVRDPTRGLDAVLRGVSQSWYSDRLQGYLDAELRTKTQPSRRS